MGKYDNVNLEIKKRMFYYFFEELPKEIIQKICPINTFDKKTCMTIMSFMNMVEFIIVKKF